MVRSIINTTGLDVIDVGQLPTPCLQFLTKHFACKGGLMITASHNPPDYNGIKPCASDGIEISREDELKVEELFHKKEFSTSSSNSNFGKVITISNIVDHYFDAVLNLVDVEKIKKRDFSIVMDIGNGVQSNVAPYLLKKLGCRVLTINSNIDGDFSGRGPEPTTENLDVLSSIVISSKADFGVAYDGDGDRSIFCDDKGIIYPGDKTASLLLKHLLTNRHSKAQIVCPINTTMQVSLVAEELGSEVIYTKVGSVEVSREMKKRGALLGLEENGGFMYGPLNEVRDGAMTTALMLDMLANENNYDNDDDNGKSGHLSDLFANMKTFFNYKTKFVCKTREIANQVVEECSFHGSPKKIEKMDGVKIWIDEETWIMIRPSGTEPLVRMYGESTSKTLLDSKIRDYARIISNVIEKNTNIN